jgi:hypothetical protein
MDEDVTVVDPKTQRERKIARKTAMMLRLANMAIKGEGNLDAIKYATDRIDGKPVQPISGGVPVTEGPDPNISPEERARIQKEMDTFLGRKK